MMKDVTAEMPGIINIHSSDHYTIDVQQMCSNTVVTCPFDKSMQVGRNEHGEVCLIKKSLFKPFKKC